MRNIKNKLYETLHSHTTDSDGMLNHLEVLDVCKNNNIGVVAFTDHDSLPSKKTVNLLRDINHPVKWILGIEMSSGWPLDLGGGATSGLHVVGLFVDPFNSKLVKHCKLAKDARIERMQKMVKNLNRIGFKVTEKDCLKASGGESVGRPHVVTALGYYEENKTVLEQLRLKMKTDSTKDSVIREKFENMMARGVTQYPYELFLSDDSYIKDIYVDYGYFSDFDKTVAFIRNSGGIAVLAHWGSCRFKMNDEYMDKVFETGRIDGAETVYGLWNYDSGNWDEQEVELKNLKNLVNKHGILESGGADAHTVEDFKQFTREKWFSERTVNMTQKLLANKQIDPKWSSFS